MQFKESLSNMEMVKQMIKEDQNEVNKMLQEKYKLEDRLAELKAKTTSYSTRKRARIIQNNNKIVDEYDMSPLDLEQVD